MQPNTRPGGGLFVFVTSESRYLVPAGYESKWITRLPKPFVPIPKCDARARNGTAPGDRSSSQGSDPSFMPH
jgi:hypothetical protein